MVAVDLGRRTLSTNDEARFAVLAQDILNRGAWLWPELNGAVYHNKPFLLAWLIALCSWPAGRVTQLTAVLPSALAGLGTALAVYALGRGLFGEFTGRFAALVAVATQGFFLHARLPLPDMLMAFFITASVAMLWPMTAGRGGAYWLGFYAFAAAAFWAKGPAGLLPLLVGLAWAAVGWRSGRWRDLRPASGLVVLAVLIAPWALREALADRAAAQQSVVTDQIFWYLPHAPTLAWLAGPVQNLFGILFPWVLVVPPAAVRAARVVRERGAERNALLFVLVWAATVLVCVALSQQQRLRYYLPVLPPAALLIGWWCGGVAVKRGSAGPPAWAAYGGAAGLAGLAAAALILRGRLPKDLHASLPSTAVEATVLVGALVVMVGALVLGAWRGRLGPVFPVAWAASAVLVAVAYHGEVGRRNEAFDYGRLRAEMSRRLPEASLVAAWGVQELPLTFYFDQPVAAVETETELHRALSRDIRSFAVVTDAAATRLEDRGRLRVLLHHRLAFRPISVVGYLTP